MVKNLLGWYINGIAVAFDYMEIVRFRDAIIFIISHFLLIFNSFEEVFAFS